MAQDGPWFNAAIGSCDAPTFTTEVTAGQTVLLVSGGLMAATPLNFSITPYGETSRPSWWSIDQTTYADSNGNVCVEVFATAVDDFGTFLMTVHGLDASQRQYNPPSLGFTVRPPAQPTETPEPTASPTPEPTDTVTPPPSETPSSTPSVTPTLTPTDLPTTTPQPSPTPDSTEPPAPAPTEPAPTQPTEPPTPAPLEPVPTEPSEPLIQYQAPEVTVPPTAAPTRVAHPTTATSQATPARVLASTRMERLFESKLATQETWQAARQVANRHSPPSLTGRANQADAQESLTSPVPVNSAELLVVAQVKAPTKDEPLSHASDLTPNGNHVAWLIAVGAVAMLLMWIFGHARH